MPDRKTERLVEMLQALTPFANAVEAYEDEPDALIITERGGITVGDLRRAFDAIAD